MKAKNKKLTFEELFESTNGKRNMTVDEAIAVEKEIEQLEEKLKSLKHKYELYNKYNLKRATAFEFYMLVNKK